MLNLIIMHIVEIVKNFSAKWENGNERHRKINIPKKENETEVTMDLGTDNKCQLDLIDLNFQAKACPEKLEIYRNFKECLFG